MFMSICTCVCIKVFLWMDVHAHIFCTSMIERECVCLLMCLCVCVYVCMYVCACIYRAESSYVLAGRRSRVQQ